MATAGRERECWRHSIKVCRYREHSDAMAVAFADDDAIQALSREKRPRLRGVDADDGFEEGTTACLPLRTYR